jgi:hypothetical protein
MQELDLDAQHVVVALTTFVGAVVTAAAAEELALGSALGDAQRRTDRGDRVVVGDDEQRVCTSDLDDSVVDIATSSGQQRIGWPPPG